MPTHNNPILSGFNPDPSLVRVGEDYYLTTSTFEYFPGLPIYHSRDLISWILIGHALTRPSQLNLRTVEPGGGIWAPTLRHHDGVFYITSCLWTAYSPQQNVRVWPRGFYVSTQDPWKADSWSDPIYFDQPGFDQDVGSMLHLFWDHDGSVYLSTCFRPIDHVMKSGLKGFAIHISKIDLATGTSLEAPRVIRRSPSGVAEGSHIIRKEQYYYLFVAEGGTESGHMELVFRSSTGVYGPWEPCPNNPLISATTQDDVQNTGHADLIEESTGEWRAVCLAVRPHCQRLTEQEKDKFVPSPFGEYLQLQHALLTPYLQPIGRETFLMDVTWEDDWPIFNQGSKLQLSFGAEADPVPPILKWRDSFEASEHLALGWYHKNTPLKREYSLKDRDHHLRLWGGPYNLQSLESPTMVLRKQTLARGIWETSLDFLPQRPHCEAGTVVYWNPYTFSSIGVRKGSNGENRKIQFTRTTSPGEFTCTTQSLKSMGSVRLAVQCSELGYTLGYAELDEEYNWFEPVSMEVMTADPPRGMAFTGMLLGLYAFGELQKCLEPADFAFAAFSGE
ncbi:glycosyl hydrolase [Aureobasidium subglaciale]|nr:glycosyl hydrolase [Aureobasidium subglaciale]